MSNDINHWKWLGRVVLDHRLSSDDKVVAYWMLEHANKKDNTSFPSVKTLVLLTGFSERQVQLARKRLVDFGWLKLEDRKPGPKGGAKYKLAMGIEALPERYAGIKAAMRMFPDGASACTNPSTDGASACTNLQGDGAQPRQDGARRRRDGAQPRRDGAQPRRDGAQPCTRDGAQPCTQTSKEREPPTREPPNEPLSSSSDSEFLIDTHTRADARVCDDAGDDHVLELEDDQTASDLFDQEGVAEGKPERRPPKKAETEQIEREFEYFWSLYPRHVGRAAAKRAFAKAIKNGTAAEVILDGVRRYAAKVAANGTEPQFVKYPSGWLNDQRWADEPEQDAPRTGLASALEGIARAVHNISNEGKWRQ